MSELFHLLLKIVIFHEITLYSFIIIFTFFYILCYTRLNGGDFMTDAEIHDLALTSAKMYIGNNIDKYRINVNGYYMFTNDLLKYYKEAESILKKDNHNDYLWLLLPFSFSSKTSVSSLLSILSNFHFFYVRSCEMYLKTFESMLKFFLILIFYISIYISPIIYFFYIFIFF